MLDLLGRPPSLPAEALLPPGAEGAALKISVTFRAAGGYGPTCQRGYLSFSFAVYEWFCPSANTVRGIFCLATLRDKHVIRGVSI